MLPIRLGMVNANGPQELFVYTLTRKGRVETTNYRTVRLPSDLDVPLFVKDRFADFYRGALRHAGPARADAGRLHRVRVGHGLVRSVRGGAADARRAARPRGLLARGRRGRLVGRGGGLPDAPARPLRRGAFSRGPRRSRRPRTGRTSRRATSCTTRSRERSRATPATTATRCAPGARTRRGTSSR